MSLITHTTEKNNLNFWAFLTNIVFLCLLIIGTYILMQTGRSLRFVNTFDVVIIVLAVFRLTRLFVYDIVMRWLRDFFVMKEEIEDAGGNVLIVRKKYPDGLKGTLQTF